MNTETDEEKTPVYPTEADRQCLKLSQALFEAREELRAAQADLAIMREGLQEIKKELGQ